MNPQTKAGSNGIIENVKPINYICPDRKRYLDAKKNPNRKEEDGHPRDCPYGHNPMELDIIPTTKNNPVAERANAQRLTLKLMRGDLGLKKDKNKEFEEPEGNKANYFKKSADIEFHANQFPTYKNIYEQTKENLSIVYTKQDRALRKNKSTKPFVPASRGGIEDLSVFAPFYPDEKKGGEDAEGENEKPSKSVWDLENPSVKPWAEDNV